MVPSLLTGCSWFVSTNNFSATKWKQNSRLGEKYFFLSFHGLNLDIETDRVVSFLFSFISLQRLTHARSMWCAYGWWNLRCSGTDLDFFIAAIIFLTCRKRMQPKIMNIDRGKFEFSKFHWERLSQSANSLKLETLLLLPFFIVS